MIRLVERTINTRGMAVNNSSVVQKLYEVLCTKEADIATAWGYLFIKRTVLITHSK